MKKKIVEKTTPKDYGLYGLYGLYSWFSSPKLLLFVNVGIVIVLVWMFFGHSANPKKKETKETKETFEEAKQTNEISLDSSFSDKNKQNKQNHQEEYQNYNYQPQMSVSNPDINSDSTYNTLDNYNDSIHFRVSCPRAKALEAQVSRCEGPYPWMSPETLMKKQKYNCKSYLCRGGYDANKGEE